MAGSKNSKTEGLVYKGHPLRRAGNLIYYGTMAEKYIIMMQVLDTRKEQDLELATKVSIQLQLTDPQLKSRDRVVKKSEKDSLYAAMDIAAVWLNRALAGLGLEGEAAAYYDGRGYLRAEVTGRGTEVLTTEKELRRLSEVLGIPLRLGEGERDRVVLVQAEPLMALAGVAARRREGQTESGDTGTWFKREDGSMFVLLCDGMGSGEAAKRESALAVRLLEDFLRSGMESAAALRTVNSALALRNEETGAFTTVDLLRIDLYTGRGELCKLGAAPTYLRRKGTVSRISGAALPAGLAEGSAGPDVTKIELGEGDCVLLVSDGISEAGEDQWLRELVGKFDGGSPKDLAKAVMEESESRVGAADDRTAGVITLKKRG